MFIEPIKGIEPLLSFDSTQKANKSTDATIFGDVFKNAVDNAFEKEKELEKAQYLLATGQIQDAHTVPIASAMAQLSIDSMVALRNKALEAYNELMRLNI